MSHMSRTRWGFTLLACLALPALFIMGGCSDDDDPTDPGVPADPSIVSVVITPESATFTSIGEDMAFQAKAFDAQGAAVDTVFAWLSSQSNVVVVGPDGTAIATGIGTAEIYATAGGVTDTSAVTVEVIGAPVVEWTAGGDGNWHVGANWSGGEIPGEGEYAVINAPGSYTVTLASDVTVLGLMLGNAEGNQTLATGGNSLTFTEGGLVGGAVLDTDGTVTIQGDAVWAGGTVDGSGNLVVARDADLIVTGSALDLKATLFNDGTMILHPGTSLRVRGGLLDNPSRGLIEMHGDATISVQEDGRFISAGYIEKTEGMEEASILASSATFISRGNLEIETGSLWISGGELRNIVDIAAGTHLRQSGNTVIPSIITRGDGDFEIGGRVDFGNFEGQTISLDNVILDSGSNPAISGLAKVRIDGSLIWRRGIVGDTPEFITMNETVTTFETNGTKGISGTTWTVIGRVEGDSSLDLTLHNDARILIEPRAIWSQSTGGILREGLNGSQGLIVQGTFEKIDEGAFIVETRLDCAGTLALMDGNLTVKGEFRLLESGVLTGGSSTYETTETRLTLWESDSAEFAGTLRPDLDGDFAFFIINGLIDLASTFQLELDMPITGDFPTERLWFIKSGQVLGGTLTVNVMAPPDGDTEFRVVEMFAGSGEFEEIIDAEAFTEIITDHQGVLMKR